MREYLTKDGQRVPHFQPSLTRRDMLMRGGAGFGVMALAAMLGNNPLRAAADRGKRLTEPMSAKQTDYPAKAKSVIFLFMEGGPSHIDSFDPKPLLNKLAGKPLPESLTKNLITAMGETYSPVLASKRKWKQHGQSGLWVSDWLPHVATCADDLAVVRSCVSDGINHSGGVCQMNTGSVLGGRPSLGAWTSYGLGTENQNLPAFVVMLDNKTSPVNGPRNWSSGFMPAVFQGTKIDSAGDPIPNLSTPKGITSAHQRRKLDLLGKLNRRHAQDRAYQTELDARIESYELAYRMQAEAPEAVDLSKETKATRQLYGMDKKESAPYGRMCLLARRLVERGVRFVQLYSGSGSKWDAHSGIEKNHSQHFKETDQPIAGLLKDLKARGMLEETLVVWGGEFGRTPMSEKGDGRDHNPTGFTMWFAGGGVPGGQTIGATDEVGLYATEQRAHVHDLHASILRLLGVDHTELIYLHKGRPERPDINEGFAINKLLGA